METENRDSAGTTSYLAAKTIPLLDLKKRPARLTRRDRLTVVDQAIRLLEESYVHLPQKRAMYGVDPPQRLKVLRHHIERMPKLPDDLTFHSEMLEIFNQLRDLHTNYLLPRPYRDRVACLPFDMEEYFDGDPKNPPHFMVTWVDEGVPHHKEFANGVEVLYWNGVDIRRAIELNGAREAGGNPDARYHRGLNSMTVRPLVRTLPPEEEWVSLRYRDRNNRKRNEEFKWLVYRQRPRRSAEGQAEGTGQSLDFSFDIQGARIQEFRKDMMSKTFKPDKLTKPAFKTIFRTCYRDMTGRPAETPKGNFGHIRIFTFMHPDAEKFAKEFERLLGLMQDTRGLIIDVRRNGGGNIQASERLLRLISPSKIRPIGFQFINSPLTLDLCRRNAKFKVWESSISQSVMTGDVQSRSFPITSEKDCNARRQVYTGPVVLIVDPLCYSATDIFAASFKDHGIGKILGTSPKTGAGGANVWTYSLLRELSEGTPSFDRFCDLPAGVEMRVAIRRCLRGQNQSGIPVEDLGVEADCIHLMTRRDVLEYNQDLLRHAVCILTGKPYVP